MSRRQLLRAALGFFSIAGLGLGAFASIVWFGDRVPGLDGERLIALMMLLYGVVGMTGLGAGTYLLARAVIQPAPLLLRPSTEYLKEYVAADGARRVRLTVNPDGSVAVTIYDVQRANRGVQSPARVLAPAVSLAEAEALALEAAGFTPVRE